MKSSVNKKKKWWKYMFSKTETNAFHALNLSYKMIF